MKETEEWWRKRKRESGEKNVKGEDILRKRKENDRKNLSSIEMQRKRRGGEQL